MWDYVQGVYPFYKDFIEWIFKQLYCITKWFLNIRQRYYKVRWAYVSPKTALGASTYEVDSFPRFSYDRRAELSLRSQDDKSNIQTLRIKLYSLLGLQGLVLDCRKYGDHPALSKPYNANFFIFKNV